MPSSSKLKLGILVAAVLSGTIFSIFFIFKIFPSLLASTYVLLTLGSLVFTGRGFEENIEYNKKLKAAKLERARLENEGSRIYLLARTALPMNLDGFERIRPFENEFDMAKYYRTTKEIELNYHFRSKDGNEQLFAKLIICPDSHIDSFLIPTSAVPLSEGPWTYAWSHDVYQWNDQLWKQDKRVDYGTAFMIDYYFGKWGIQSLSNESKNLIQTSRIADELKRWRSQWIDEEGGPIVASGGRVVWPSSPKRKIKSPQTRTPFPNWGVPKVIDLPQNLQVPGNERYQPDSVNPKCIYLRISGKSNTSVSLFVNKTNFENLKALVSIQN